MNKKLSILICSLESRSNKLERLMSILNKQIIENVEILIEIDNGESIIGDKRQKLLEKSQGEYICFVDDDDIVSSDYVPKILNATEGQPDAIGIDGIWIDKEGVKKIIWGKDYIWEKKNNIYYIGTNHITPVRKDIAIKVGFPSKSIAEDTDYGIGIRRLIKTENRTHSPLYYYYCDLSHKDTKMAYRRHKK